MFKGFSDWVDTRFIYIIGLLIVLKLIISGFAVVQYDGNTQTATGLSFVWKKNFGSNINPDDYEMARTAFYHLEGRGFLADNSFGRPQFRQDSIYKTAFRPKFNILLHRVGLLIYNHVYSRNPITSADTLRPHNSLAIDYMHYFGLLAFLLQALVYPISVYYFLKLALVFLSPIQAKVCTIMYCIYPSVFIFMDVTVFEKVVTPLIIIIISQIAVGINSRPNIYSVLFLGGLALLTALMRPHVLAVWLLMITVYGVISLYKYIFHKSIFRNFPVFISIGVFLVIGHLPILVVHYQDFGQYFLSSQSSLEFFQGHNPYARGSWYPGIWQNHSDELKQMFASEPGLSAFNEKQELDFYAKQAWSWIIHNPLGELELIARKTAIYLLPYSFMNHRFNLLLLLTHLGVLGFFFYSIPVKVKSWSIHIIIQHAFVCVPVIACYLLTLVFFVGERWRYYSEPFMIILAFIFFKDLIELIKSRRKTQMYSTT